MPQCFKCRTDASVGKVALRDTKKWVWVRDWQLHSSRNNFSIEDVEACDIYCRSCWKDWGQHVKPGCHYALSKVCEELAVQAGVKFEWTSPDAGYPFYCQFCRERFNHGANGLEYHLLTTHNPALKHERYTPPPLVVSCSDSTFNWYIAGTYTAKGWHHGKPLYQKEGRVGTRRYRPVFLYFWFDGEGLGRNGWRISPQKVGNKEVWAFNPSRDAVDDVAVPAFGWKVPWDGAVDESMHVTPDVGAMKGVEMEPCGGEACIDCQGCAIGVPVLQIRYGTESS